MCYSQPVVTCSFSQWSNLPSNLWIWRLGFSWDTTVERESTRRDLQFPINEVFFFSDSGGFYTDSTHSFLFSFKNRYGLDPFKLHIKYSEHAIYGNNGYGPTFGDGHDIYIADNAGSNTNSYTNLGNNYVQLAGYKYGDSNTRNLLAGSYSFQPHEVEVFFQTFKNWF